MLFRLFVVPALLALAGCSAFPLNAVPPEVSVAAVEVTSVGLLEQHFDVGLRVANPNGYDLTIEALDFELEVNGHPLAKGQARGGARIPAASTAVVQVGAVMLSQDLMRQIENLEGASLKRGVPYRLKGRVKTGRSPVWLPFDRAGVYGGEAAPPPRTGI